MKFKVKHPHFYMLRRDTVHQASGNCQFRLSSFKTFTFLICFMPVCLNAQPQDQSPPIDGYVTRVTSASDFDVNGVRVLCGEQTQSSQVTGQDDQPGHKHSSFQGCPRYPIYIGEPMKIFGTRNKKEHTVNATQIQAPTPQPSGELSGAATVMAVPEQGTTAKSESLLVWADGYPIQITEHTGLAWSSPLNSLINVKPGDWIEYKGKQRPDGVLVADDAKFSPNVVNKGEGKFREKSEYKAADVSASANHPEPVKTRNGLKIPLWTDPAMQARVSAIGEKLVPAYQKAMTDTDPAKIDFRFQLVDGKKLRNISDLPSGIILIPYEAVERMQNDSQLAEVLSDGIAFAMEKESYRMRARITGVAVSSFLIFNPLIAYGITAEAESAAIAKAHQQSERVSLELMKTAGYDIDQAPQAWWLLATKKPEPLAETKLPDRAAYLYGILGTTWRNLPPAKVSDR